MDLGCGTVAVELCDCGAVAVDLWLWDEVCVKVAGSSVGRSCGSVAVGRSCGAVAAELSLWSCGCGSVAVELWR